LSSQDEQSKQSGLWAQWGIPDKGISNGSTAVGTYGGTGMKMLKSV